MKSPHTRLRLACYTTNVAMSVVGNLSPLLFLTFHELYGLSFTMLGLLVLVNFVTQLGVDLAFSFFSHKFNIPKCVKFTPALTTLGLIIYALWPFVFPNNIYPGLVIGTIIFASSGGLVEVLLTPVVAALPSDNPDRDVSRLHSFYAWGVVGVVIIVTLCLHFFGHQNWQWMALIGAAVPLTAFLLYLGAELPHIDTPEGAGDALAYLRKPTLWLCVSVIFLGGSAECTMAQWSSGYIEKALGIPKIWGDMFGTALFAAMLGLGRSLYSKYGRNVESVLLASAVGSALCYLTAAIAGSPLVGLIACALTGFCAAMLWPGSLITATDRFPMGGVFIYAMMASGGDLGASVGPQLVGVITDAAIASPAIASMAAGMGLDAAQLGMKLGMLVGMLFPLAAIPLFAYMCRHKVRS